jgi:hypothetical protein
MRIPLPGFSLSAAVWVINWVHRHSADMWPPSEPSFSSSFPDRNVLMIGITHLANRGHAFKAHHTDFPGVQLQLPVITLFGHQLGGRASSTRQLPTFSSGQFNVMDRGAQWDITKSQRIASANFGFWPRHHYIPNVEPCRCQDIALFPVDIVE